MRAAPQIVGKLGPALGTHSAKFEGLLERLQTPAARDGLEAAFNATPAELGQAAVEAAQGAGLNGPGLFQTVGRARPLAVEWHQGDVYGLARQPSPFGR